MTDIATIAGERTDMIGPGRLVLVTGPSGAGKDTLIDLVQAACADNDAIVFPRRTVTREASVSENNESVTPNEFGRMLARGDFAFQWQAHGLRYGLSYSVVDDIRAGRTVVVNVSRTIVESARRSYARVTVVLVTAPSDILAQRLAMRARQSDGQLDGRLRRTVTTADPDVVINNIGPAQDHAARLLKVINSA